MKTTSYNVWRLFFLSFLALMNVSLSWIEGWSYDGHSFVQYSFSLSQAESVLPKKVALIDGIDFCLELHDGKAAVNSCTGSAINYWKSPDDWDVREAFLSDLNRDGIEEITLLVWRDFQPWPVDRFLPKGGRINTFHDSRGESCHIIMLRWQEGTFEEAWAGSAMSDPLRDIHAVDLDGDGVEELTGLEYPYDSNKNEASLVVWEWNGFGFSLGDRVIGKFSTLQILEHQQDIVLAVQKKGGK